MARKKELDFEQTMSQLETLVKRLETENLPLEDALKTFEEGIKLAQAGQQKLNQAEQRIQILLEKNANASLDDFSPPHTA